MSQTEKELTEMIESLKKFKVDPNQNINRDLHIKYVDFVLHELGSYIAHF